MKKLVAYFSCSGRTAERARELAAAAGADLFEIESREPYSGADLNWRDRNSRCSREMNDPSSRPELKKAELDLSDYDDIYIGYPIWWGIAPREINTFVEANDLKGKRIAIFATSGGSGIDYALKDLRASYPELNIVTGVLARGKLSKDIL